MCPNTGGGEVRANNKHKNRRILERKQVEDSSMYDNLKLTFEFEVFSNDSSNVNVAMCSLQQQDIVTSS